MMTVSSITEQSGRVVVALTGEIDMEEAPKVRRALLDCMKQKRDILVDLSQVTYIDSSGIASLIEGLQAARKQKNDLVLVSVSQRGPARSGASPAGQGLHHPPRPSPPHWPR
jgi:anti-sigma B factor antagonist